MTAAERALEVLDSGLQHSPEPAMLVAEDGYCWRCTWRAVAEGSDLCSGCRAYLLEDSELDPRTMLLPEEVEAIAAFVNELVDAVRPILERIVEALVPIAEALAPILDRLRPLFEAPARVHLARRNVEPPGVPWGDTRPALPRNLPMRDLRTTEAPRTAPTPRRRIRP